MANIVETMKNAVRMAGRKAVEKLPLSADSKVQLKYLAFALVGPVLGVRRSTPQDAATRLHSVGERYLELSAVACGHPQDLPPRSVSIVIPVFNQLSYTLRCLDAIKNNTEEIEHEIIVVDDASSDDTEATLSARDDIIYVRNPQNLGFVGSCNAGAARATKNYVCFLNNDTTVQPYWLSALVNTFELHPHVGLAGSKLVYPDGRLQEAGGLVWEDGSAWNWGRLQNPDNPRYNYARCTDYCSGASIVVPRALFESLGGFDSHYAPAYAEDTDLAFRIRALGLATVYQPLSQVIHYEGVTSGTDTSQGVKKYQIANLEKLAKRWAPVLPHQGPTDNAALACDRGIAGRLLVLDQITPEPDRDAGSVAALEIFNAFRALGYKITFVPCSNLSDIPPYTDLMASMGVESVLLPWAGSVSRHLKQFGSHYDAVLIFRPVTWNAYIKKVRKYAPQAKVIFHVCDLHFLRYQREAEVSGKLSKADAAKLESIKRAELDLIASADLTTIHSPIEKDMIEAERPGTRVVCIPIIYEPRGRGKPASDRSGILFVGGYRHPPNIDAVEYYLSDVHPLVKERLPEDAPFTAAGSSPPPSLEKLAGTGVSVPGFVEDLGPLLDKARVMVAPLRFGAGVKGKILTAFAHGLPVVTTSIGAEGISEGEEMLVADDAASLAEAICKLHTDDSLWHQLQEAGLDYVRKNTSRDVAVRAVADVLVQLDLPYLVERVPSCQRSEMQSNFGSPAAVTDVAALIGAGARMLPAGSKPDLAIVPDNARLDHGSSNINIARFSDSETLLPAARSIVLIVDPTDIRSTEAIGKTLAAHLAAEAAFAVVIAPQRLVGSSDGYVVKAPFSDDPVDEIDLPYHEVLDGLFPLGTRDCAWQIDTSLSGFPALSILRIV